MKETIEIFIEANYQKLQIQLQQVEGFCVKMVQNLNSKRVNWETILAQTISPAIISGIASSFALAITEAVSFQNQMMGSTDTINSTTTQNMGQVSEAIKKMASDSSLNTNEAQKAFEAFNSILADPTAATSAVKQLDLLASGLNIDLLSALKMVTPIMEQWGIRTLPGLVDMMTNLRNANGKGLFSIEELSTSLAENGEVMKRSGIKIGEYVQTMQSLTREGQLSREQVNLMFAAIKEGVSNPLGDFNIMNHKVIDSLGENGLIKTIAAVSTHVQSLGDNWTLTSKLTGTNTETARAFGDFAPASVKKVTTAVDTHTDSMKSLTFFSNTQTTQATKLAKAWNDVANSLYPLGDALIPILTAMTELLKLTPKVGQVFGDAFAHLGQNIGSAVGDFIFGGTPTGRILPPGGDSKYTTPIANQLGVSNLPSAQAGGKSTGTTNSKSSAVSATINLNVTSSPGFETQTADEIVRHLKDFTNDLTSKNI